ncbi:Hypothetical predicted protein [Mytilus galloprovincialis]|uniref:Uncharacterized protein n=1 Tax=Mytilus galloprovincialis TaxID=29158 RepID=A0A8B6HC48_MYTGA|nr:Hypothetical predicted protein [Mytilus galloprovincialis]
MQRSEFHNVDDNEAKHEEAELGTQSRHSCRERPFICLDVESFPWDSEADHLTTDDKIVEVTIGNSEDMSISTA